MNIFDDTKLFCSWCDLANNESAGKKKSVRSEKAGNYIKPVMVQCALVTIKSRKQPYFAIKYGHIKKRRGHKKTIIAIARMMVCTYHMVSEKPFILTDYEKLIDPQNHVERITLNENNTFSYLETLGYDNSYLQMNFLNFPYFSRIFQPHTVNCYVFSLVFVLMGYLQGQISMIQQSKNAK